MTAQIAERLRYNGADVAMCTEPLGNYFEMGGFDPQFRSPSTALWRGYVGHWEIVDSRLYLIQLEATLQDGTAASLATVFPGFPDRVFAHWYSGTIRLPQGKLLNYVHMGYGSTYEQDVLLDIEQGVLVETRVRQNGTAASADAPAGYRVDAMLTFPKSTGPEGSEA